MSVNIKQETITPEYAAMLLETVDDDFKNRPSSVAAIDRMAEDMVAGNWIPTHQAVAMYLDKLKRRWVVVDGKHRFNAVVKAAVPVVMLVAYYDTKENALKAVPAMDLGTPRKAHHIADMIGATANLSGFRCAATRVYYAIETGKMPGKSFVVHHVAGMNELFDSVYSPNWRSPGATLGTFMFACKMFPWYDVPALALRVAAGEGLSKSEAVLQKTITAGGSGMGNVIKQCVKVLRAIEACTKGEVLRSIPERKREDYIDRLLAQRAYKTNKG